MDLAPLGQSKTTRSSSKQTCSPTQGRTAWRRWARCHERRWKTCQAPWLMFWSLFARDVQVW